MRSLIIVLFFSLFLSGPLHAQIASPIEVDSFLETLESNYAPMTFKEGRYGFLWSEKRAQLREKLLSARSTHEFYLIVSEVLGDLQDVHVSIGLPSSYQKSLPFQTVWVQGKTIVNYIGDDIVRAEDCALEVGDEMVRLDGKSISEWHDILRPYVGTGNARTDLNFLTHNLLNRKEARNALFYAEDNDIAALEFSRENGSLFRCHLKWKKVGLPMLDLQTISPLNSERLSGLAENKQSLFWSKTPDIFKKYYSSDDMMTLKSLTNTHHEMLNLDVGLRTSWLGEEDNSEGKKLELGAKEPFFEFPEEFKFKPFKPHLLMKPIWFLTGLNAGTFEYEGQRVGFLRIPSYVPLDLLSAHLGLKNVIKYLNENSDWLLVDQTNNPGGYVAFSDWIIKAFVGEIEDVKHMKFKFRSNRNVMSMYRMLQGQLEVENDQDEDENYKIDLKKRYGEKLESELGYLANAFANKGLELSAEVSLSVISELTSELIEQPFKKYICDEDGSLNLVGMALEYALGFNPVGQYSYDKNKPIVMFINEMDFSGGDATPAILQDYGRATLVGVTTGGAGGSVSGIQHGLRNSFSYSVTQSLMMRSSGQLVENIGVQPEIPFELSVSDVKEEFKNVLPRLLKTLKKEQVIP